MPGTLLTTAATMMCPHGGTVQGIPSGPRLSLGGATALLAADTFLVGGCPFVPVVPHPCVTVQWQLSAQQSSGSGAAALTLDSVGFCKAADGAVQGPVLIVAAPAMATGV